MMLKKQLYKHVALFEISWKIQCQVSMMRGYGAANFPVFGGFECQAGGDVYVIHFCRKIFTLTRSE